MSAIDFSSDSFLDNDLIKDVGTNPKNETAEKTDAFWQATLASLCLLGAIATGTYAYTASRWFLVPSISFLLSSGTILMYGKKEEDTIDQKATKPKITPPQTTAPKQESKPIAPLPPKQTAAESAAPKPEPMPMPMPIVPPKPSVAESAAPKPEPMLPPKPAAPATPKQELKPAPKPAAPTAPKQELKPESKPAAPAAPRQAPKAESKPSAPAAPRQAPKAESKPSAPAAPRQEHKPDSKPAAPTAPKQAPKPESKPVAPKQEKPTAPDAKAKNLSQLIAQVGWNKLNTVLSPAEFEAAYSSSVQGMDLKKMIRFYEEAYSKLQGSGFKIPAPSVWKQKLFTETNGLIYQRVLTYDLPTLIRHSLIEPKELAKSFETYAQSLALPRVIEEYEKVAKLIAQFPHAAALTLQPWSAKFKKETALLKASEITAMSAYPIKKMFEHKIIDISEYQLLLQTVEVRNKFNQHESYLEQAAKSKISDDRDEAKKRADMLADPIYLQQKELNSAYFQKIKIAETLAKMKIEAELAILSTYEKAHPMISSEEGARLKKQCEEACSKIKQEFFDQKAKLQQEHVQKKAKLDEALQKTKKIIEESHKHADQVYNMSMQAVRQSIDHDLSMFRENLKANLALIDQAYDRLRAEK